MTFIPWYIFALRLLVPLTILRFPLWGLLGSMMADGLDWMVIGVTSSEMDSVYQFWDKSFDLYFQFFALWVVFQWKDLWAKKVAIISFGYRIFGTIIFLLTGFRWILFLTPNIFDNFVIVCLILFWISKRQKLNLNKMQKWILLALLIIPKTFHEYFQHFLIKQPWEIYSPTQMLGTHNSIIDSMLYGFALYVIPLSAFLIHLKASKKL